MEELRKSGLGGAKMYTRDDIESLTNDLKKKTKSTSGKDKKRKMKTQKKTEINNNNEEDITEL